MNQHVCYLSMKYNSPCIDPFRDILDEAAREVGLGVLRSDEQQDSGVDLRNKIKQDIDRSLVFVCEGTGFSWIVSFELTYALERRKPCILVVQDPRPECLLKESDVSQLYPDKLLTKYSLRSKQDRDKLRGKMKELIQNKLNELLPSIRNIRDILSEGNIFGPPDILDYVPHRIIWNGEEFEEEKLWEAMTSENHCNRLPFVIVAPPGGGKSFLLGKIRDRFDKEFMSKKFDDEHDRPLLIFINLGSMSDRISDKSTIWPWDIIREEIQQTETPDNHSIKLESIVDTFKYSGLIYLFLDGLDEFGMKYNVRPLLTRSRNLVSQGLKVFVTSRKWFWEREIHYQKGFNRLEILPFDIEQAIKLAKSKGNREVTKALGREQRAGKTANILRTEGNPLLLSYLTEVYSQVDTKTDIYFLWSDYISEKDARNFKVEPDVILSFFEELAVILAREKMHNAHRQLRDEAISKIVPSKARERVTSNSIMNSGFFMGKEVERFKHFSIHEFFLARRLSSDFKEIVESKKPNELLEAARQDFQDSSELVSGALLEQACEDLALHRVPLDYMGTTVYGFICEILNKGKPPFSFENRLLEWLLDFSSSTRERHYCKPFFPSWHPFWELLRNCVEYVGLVFHSDLYKGSKREKKLTIDVMLEILTNPAFDSVVRYNAARVLERIHASAPQPYFDFMSDWGSVDWSKRTFDKNTWAYAMRRGTRSKPRGPGKRPPMAIDFNRLENTELEDKVSIKLLEIVSSPKTEEEIRVNCTYALVRWCYRGDDVLDKLQIALKTARQVSDSHSEKNIQTWIKRSWQKWGIDLQKLE